jgi:site-specific DNA recombinase
MPTWKAAIYCRISRDRVGDRLGVERQEPPCRALAARLSWDVVEVYTDDDTSAYSGKRRPAYERMLHDVRVDRVNAIIVWAADRLTRRPVENEEIINLAERLGVKLATVTGDYDLGTPSGRLHFRQLGIIARYESEHRAERLRLKHEELAHQGRNASGGVRPFGFQPNRVELEAAEAEEIRTAARRLIVGESVYAILADWRGRGVTTPAGRVWLATSFRRMITSPRVAGLRQLRGEVVGPAAWPAILDRATWERVRAVFVDPARRKAQGPPHTYLLTGGLARCGFPVSGGVQWPGLEGEFCGKALVAARNHRRRSYTCLKVAPYDGCGRISRWADPVEELISEMVIQELAGPGLSEALRRVGDDSDHDGLVADLAEDEAALAQLAADHYSARLISRAEYLAARSALEAKIIATRRALGRRHGADALADLPRAEEALRAAWAAGSVDWRRVVLGAVLEAVVVGPAVRGRNRFDPHRIHPVWRV